MEQAAVTPVLEETGTAEVFFLSQLKWPYRREKYINEAGRDFNQHTSMYVVSLVSYQNNTSVNFRAES